MTIAAFAVACEIACSMPPASASPRTNAPAPASYASGNMMNR
jgi:hypothetical protein